MKENIEEAIDRLEYVNRAYDCNNYYSRYDLDCIQILLSDYKRVLKENEELKEYIAIAPNLDEMTATKYRNIQQDAYIQGRAEEQQKVEQIIYENYIPIQKVKDKIEELKKKVEELTDDKGYWGGSDLLEQIKVLQELLES